MTSGLKIGHRESLQLYVTCSSGFHSLVLSHIAQGWRTDTWNDSSICNENLLDNQGTNNLHTYTKVALYIHKHEWWQTNVYYTRVRLIYTPFAGNRTIRLKMQSAFVIICFTVHSYHCCLLQHGGQREAFLQTNRFWSFWKSIDVARLGFRSCLFVLAWDSLELSKLTSWLTICELCILVLNLTS